MLQELLPVLLLIITSIPGGDSTVFSVLSSVFSDDRFPDDVIKFAIDSCDALPIELIFSRLPDEPKNVLVNVFTPSFRRVYRIQDVRKLLLENPKINSIRQTTIYVHGWRNHPLDESSQAIVKALLSKDVNVLVVDASKYMKDLYLSASSHVYRLGEVLNKFLVRLTERVPVKRIDLIGFSLGAHISGVAGKLFQRQTGRILERITALDPAKPCFERLDDRRLSKDDAKYVEVIHTNSGTLGMREPIGDADFYVNGLSGNQPECRKKLIRLECDHAQAWKLFAASVENEGMLLAKHCQTWNELRNDECSGSEFAMGYGTASTTKGLFYMKTTKKLSRKQRYSERRVLRERTSWMFPRWTLR